jgi:hypothetical protein
MPATAVSAVSKSETARRAAACSAVALLALGCGGAAAVPRDAAITSDAPVATVDASADAGDRPSAVDAGPSAVDAGPSAVDARPSAVDAGPSAIDAAVPPAPYPRPTYQHLSETGLYSEIASLAVDPSAIPFVPGYKLWSDGATKRRWIRLPPGTKIDTFDMDHWVFPIGTHFWKEFSLNGVLLETRLVERYGTGPDDYWLGAFVWNADQTEADFVPDGQQNVAGTMHDAPAQKDCDECHRGDVGRVLGFSAIQLSAASTTPNLQSLNAAGLLSDPPAPGGYPLGADPATTAALGYLHANCGHCHNQNGTSWPDTQMVLRSVVADTGLDTSAVYRSLVNVPLEYWRGGAITVRLSPGQPDGSAIVARMSARGNDDQMPPLATELVDSTGLETIRQWISGLSP